MDIIGDPDDLITEVKHRSRSEARKIVKKAEKEAEKIEKEAEEHGKRERDRIIQEARRKARIYRKRRGARMSRDEKKGYLELRQEKLLDVWDRARDRLKEITQNESDHDKILNRLAMESIEILGPGEYVLGSDAEGHELLDKKWLEDLKGRIEKELEISVSLEREKEPLDISGGLMVTENKGRRRVNASFENRLDLAWEEIRSEVFEKLVKS